MLRSIITVGCETNLSSEMPRRQQPAETRRRGRLHRNRGRQAHNIAQRAHGADDAGSETERGRDDIEIRALGKDQKRKMEEVAEQRRDVDAEPGAGDAADDDADHRR